MKSPHEIAVLIADYLFTSGSGIKVDTIKIVKKVGMEVDQGSYSFAGTVRAVEDIIIKAQELDSLAQTYNEMKEWSESPVKGIPTIKMERWMDVIKHEMRNKTP